MPVYVARLISANTGNEKFVKKTATDKVALRKALGFIKSPHLLRGYWYGGAFTLEEFYVEMWEKGGSSYRSANRKYAYTSWKDVPADYKALTKGSMRGEFSKF